MNSVRFVWGLFLALAVGFVLMAGVQGAAQAAEEENHCFTCHTNARKLIQITREIAEADKGKKAASAESEGEG